MAENINMEFKREFTDDIKKTVVAFANTVGGTICIGLDDEGEPYGITDMDDTMLRMTNSIREGIKPDVTMFVDYAQERRNDKDILIVHVQKGTSSPYYLSGKGIRPEGVYVRQGSSSVPASETAILKMIKETDGDSYERARSLVQNLTFDAASREFQQRGVSFERENMRTLKLLNEDDVYTNLGLLLSDQCRHTIKLAVFQGDEKEIFKDRREFGGSLLQQLNDAFGYLDLLNATHADFEGLHRYDKRDYPVEALREALLNIVVHRDYSFRSSALISVFPNRMEFVSVGGLVRGITLADIMLGISVARNENLANVFYRLKLIEAYGTGIPKIIKSYAGYTEPKIEATDNAFKITLTNQNAQPKH